jgi:hypothetical protein
VRLLQHCGVASEPGTEHHLVALVIGQVHRLVLGQGG